MAVATLNVIGARQLRDELAGVLARLKDLPEIVVTQRGEARAVLIDLDRYNALLERLEYMEDSIDALTADTEGAVPAEEVFPGAAAESRARGDGS
jgi:prevent-host-death family protein